MGRNCSVENHLWEGSPRPIPVTIVARYRRQRRLPHKTGQVFYRAEGTDIRGQIVRLRSPHRGHRPAMCGRCGGIDTSRRRLCHRRGVTGHVSVRRGGRGDCAPKSELPLVASRHGHSTASSGRLAVRDSVECPCYPLAFVASSNRPRPPSAGQVQLGAALAGVVLDLAGRSVAGLIPGHVGRHLPGAAAVGVLVRGLLVSSVCPMPEASSACWSVSTCRSCVAASFDGRRLAAARLRERGPAALPSIRPWVPCSSSGSYRGRGWCVTPWRPPRR